MELRHFQTVYCRPPSLNKPGFSGKDAMNVIDTMTEAQIIPQVNFILFVPDITKEELLYNINKGMEVIQKGCTVAVTPYLYSIPGAPIYSDSQYPSTFNKIKCEISGRYIDISGYHIPHNNQINSLAEKFSISLEKEIQSFQSKRRSLNTILHKSILGILSFIVVAELLNQSELANKWRDDLLLCLQQN